MNKEIESEWPVWRLVTERVAHLEELNRSWTVLDIAKANAVLDMRADIKRMQMEESKK